MYTYPYVNGAGQDLTEADVHHFLKTPALVARRVAELARGKFIADFLLRGRYDATGGGVAFIVDDSVESNDDPEVIAAGAEYPLTTAGEGKPEVAPSEKEGQDSIITDESVSRLLMDPVNRALTKMVNRTIRRVDSKAMAVISSKVTSTFAASAPWTTGEIIVQDVLAADAQLDGLNLGLDANTVVLKPAQYAKVAAFFIKSDMVARGLSDVVASGVIPGVLGKSWVTSNNVAGSDPLLVDADVLGGIGVERIQSPGYSRVADVLGLEVKVLREDGIDAYRPRVRRVGTAAVVEPRAGLRITGTGL